MVNCWVFQAIHEFEMIKNGDRVLICLSGIVLLEGELLVTFFYAPSWLYHAWFRWEGLFKPPPRHASVSVLRQVDRKKASSLYGVVPVPT